VDAPVDVGFKSCVLNDIMSALPRLRGPMKELMGAINVKKAAEGNKIEMWTDPDKYSMVAETDFVRSIVLFVLTGAQFVCRA
jgi:DNA mismatch repair protein MSH3